MHKLDEKGSLLIPFILVLLILAGSLGFAFWAFAGRQEYKNNVDSKIAEAVKVAETKLSAEKDAEFAEKEKLPFATYKGPSTYGSAVISYPRTWSAYIDESQSGSTAISGYFHPNYVPSIDSEASYALRFEVVNTSYDAYIEDYDSSVSSGKTRLTAYRAPEVQSALGSKIEGELENRKQGVLVALPLRDKTILIWTEGQQFRSDFDTMLKTFSFIP